MHAKKLIHHVANRGSQVELLNIPAPVSNFESPYEAAKFVRDLERSTTEMIHRLYELACKEADHPLAMLLHWYITEQVEEEQWSSELANVIEQFKDRPAQLFMLDH